MKVVTSYIYSCRYTTQWESYDDITSHSPLTLGNITPFIPPLDIQPRSEVDEDILQLQSVLHTGQVSEPIPVYVRPRIGEVSTLDVSSIHHSSITSSLPTEPEGERFVSLSDKTTAYNHSYFA